MRFRNVVAYVPAIVSVVFLGHQLLLTKPTYLSKSSFYVATQQESGNLENPLSSLVSTTTESSTTILLSNFVKSDDFYTEILEVPTLNVAEYIERANPILNLTGYYNKMDHLKSSLKDLIDVKLDYQGKSLEVNTIMGTSEQSVELNRQVQNIISRFIDKSNANIKDSGLALITSQMSDVKRMLVSELTQLNSVMDSNYSSKVYAYPDKVVGILSSLEKEKVSTTQAIYEKSSYLNESSPTIMKLNSRLESINAEIEKQNAQLKSATVTQSIIESKTKSNTLMAAYTDQFGKMLVALKDNSIRLIPVSGPSQPDTSNNAPFYKILLNTILGLTLAQLFVNSMIKISSRGEDL